MEIRWAFETEKGQIHVPKINFMLLAVLLLIAMFRSPNAPPWRGIVNVDGSLKERTEDYFAGTASFFGAEVVF